jgi:Zn-dependent protease
VPTPTEIKLVSYGLLIASIILHEISHGWAALALGDDTAKRSGRLTLNPVPHIDPIGSIVVPGLLLATGAGFIFGWAKPVPVNVTRLRHPRNDAVLTGLAGPAMNLVLVALSYVLLRQLRPETFWPAFLLFQLGFLNLMLAIFNLIPIPPLDGSAVVERLVPARYYHHYLAFIRPYPMLLVFALVIVGQESGVYGHAFNALYNSWASATGYF